MYDLIEVRKDDLFTNSKVIAEGTENQHKNVKELIEKYQNDIEDFGTKGGDSKECYQQNLIDKQVEIGRNRMAIEEMQKAKVMPMEL